MPICATLAGAALFACLAADPACLPAEARPHRADIEAQAERTVALQESRRSFLRGTLVGATAAASLVAAAPLDAAVADEPKAKGPTPHKYHYVPATDKTVHWGYFSKSLEPVLRIDSGDYITLETLTHHANDDAERMVKGDPGAESVFYWDKDKKKVGRSLATQPSPAKSS